MTLSVSRVIGPYLSESPYLKVLSVFTAALRCSAPILAISLQPRLSFHQGDQSRAVKRLPEMNEHGEQKSRL